MLVATPITSVLVPFHLACGPETDVELAILDSALSLDSRFRFRTPSGILVELRKGTDSSRDLIERLRNAYPHVPILAVVRALTEDRDLVPGAIAAGANDLVLIGYEDLTTCVKRVCGGAADISPEERILQALQPYVPRDVWAFMTYAVRTAVRRLSVDQFAEAFGLTRSALSRKLRKDGFASTTQLIGFARALVAASLLQGRAAHVKTVAQQLRFGTPYAMRLFLRKQFGIGPSQIRRGLHVAWVLERVVASQDVAKMGLDLSLLLQEIARGLTQLDDGDSIEDEAHAEYAATGGASFVAR
jgi:AraC-like DNA-binding protein